MPIREVVEPSGEELDHAALVGEMVAEVAFASLEPPVMSRTGAVRRRRLGLPTEASGTIFQRAMTYTSDRRVDAHIDSLPDWQQDI